jgi:hypothetical protein
MPIAHKVKAQRKSSRSRPARPAIPGLPAIPAPSAIPGPSAEQAHAIELFSRGKNILVDSVAGGGKTTFILHLARANPRTRMLFITYNKRLQTETENRARGAQCGNIDAYTYHALCGLAHGVVCRNDADMSELLAHDGFALATHYDAIVIDEAQDIAPLTFRLIGLCIEACTTGAPDAKILPRVCVIGDKYQMIYGYNGSDARFLTMFPEILGIPFERVSFSQTFRCTIPMADFVNELIRGLAPGERAPRMISRKPGAPVNYVFAHFSDAKKIADRIADAMRTYGAENIFCIAPSLKGDYLVHKVANKLSKSNRAEVYVPASDLEDIGCKKDSVLRRKLCFLSYHQSKGLERDHVFVFGFDAGYFACARDMPPSTLSNAQYVALTRAKTEITVIRSLESAPLAFLTDRALDHCAFAYPIPSQDQWVNNGRRPSRKSVTQLVSHKTLDVLARALACVDYVIARPASDKCIAIPVTTASRGNCVEEVSEITGTAIPIALAFRIGAGEQVEEHIFDEKNQRSLGGAKSIRRDYWTPFREQLRGTVPYYARLAAVSCAIDSRYVHKLIQIRDWEWITRENMDLAVARLRAEIEPTKPVHCEQSPAEIQFEVSAEHRVSVARGESGSANYIICGRIDCIVSENGTRVHYEIKCTSGALRSEHILQLACYAFLTLDGDTPCDATGAKQEYRLFNVRSGELIILRNLTRERLTEMVRILIVGSSAVERDDPAFIAYARELLDRNHHPSRDDESESDDSAPNASCGDIDLLRASATPSR